eukprot:185064_1
MNAITYSSLTHLLPNGIAQITKYSIEESTKINNRIDREKESKILAANQFLLTCIKGKCRRSINLLAPQTMKALNYNSKHIQSMHKNEAREPLEEEILIHSYISVTGTGRKKKYKDHFQLLKPINKSTFQYIKQPKKTLFTSLSNQPISYYDEIDLFKQKSSIPPKKSKQSKSSKTSSSTTSAPSASSAPTSLSPTKAISPLAADEKDIIRIDKKDFNKLINKIELLLHLEELIYFEFQGVTLNAANVYDGENTEHMANKVFKNDVMLKYERRNNIKYSQTLD